MAALRNSLAVSNSFRSASENEKAVFTLSLGCGFDAEKIGHGFRAEYP